jgi:hypothetical protein
MRRLVGIVALLVFASAYADDKIIDQTMRFVERGQNLTATGESFTLFDAAAYEQLSSGFTSTVQIGTAVYARNNSRTPIAIRVELRTVVYDHWDEQYVIRIDGPSGKRTRKVKYRAEALKILTAIEDMPIARLAEIPYEQVFYLTMTVQLNPVSQETLAEVRRWLSHGTGGIDRGGVFFGSFVSVFVNPKIADADRVVRIRSQAFYRPKP